MKIHTYFVNTTRLATCATFALGILGSLHAVDKADNADALYLDSSWGGTAPSSTESARFLSNLAPGPRSWALGGNVHWGSIVVDGAPDITIGNSGGEGFSITLGPTTGAVTLINMSAATSNLTINNALVFQSSGTSTINVAAGRTLTLNNSLTNTAGTTMLSGGGTFNFGSATQKGATVTLAGITFGTAVVNVYNTVNNTASTGNTNISGTTTLNIYGTYHNNADTINARGLVVGNTGTGAMLHIFEGGTYLGHGALSVGTSNIINGTVIVDAGGTLTNTNNNLLVRVGSTFTVNGTASFSSSASTEGRLLLYGTATVGKTGTLPCSLTGSRDLVVESGGTLLIDGGTVNVGTTTAIGTSATANSGTLTISGGGTLQSAAAINIYDTLTATQTGGTIQGASVTFNSGSTFNAGKLTFANGLTLKSGSTVNISSKIYEEPSAFFSHTGTGTGNGLSIESGVVFNLTGNWEFDLTAPFAGELGVEKWATLLYTSTAGDATLESQFGNIQLIYNGKALNPLVALSVYEGNVYLLNARALPIPEPSTWALLGAAAAFAVIARRRKSS